MPHSTPTFWGSGENSIDLAYTPVRFQYAPKFDAFYPALVSLLTDKDTVVFGYAVENDIGFLYSDCHRYQKPMPNFTFYDIQEIYRIYREWDRSPSLEDALKDLNVPFDSYAEHRSSDDAEMSMLLLKEMAQEIGQSAEELVKTYPTSGGSTPTFMIQAKLMELPQRDLGFPYDADSRENSRTFNQLIHYVEPGSDEQGPRRPSLPFLKAGQTRYRNGRRTRQRHHRPFGRDGPLP
jgi:DNA polymerase III epsilon subunit-like protein